MCTKCNIHGEFIDRVCFPEPSGTKRTDESFKNFDYNLDYQKGISFLVRIPLLGLVTGVPLDYMHLICIGIMRKMLQLWLKGPLSKNVRSSGHEFDVISDTLKAAEKCVPSDFNRKPRPLKHLKFWKATELRTFLLYLGPVVLRNVIRRELCEHSILLHITILVSPIHSSLESNVDFAEELLRHFVSDFGILYGEKFISHNVHNLLHLADDVRRFGSLDNFSSFRFENPLHWYVSEIC